MYPPPPLSTAALNRTPESASPRTESPIISDTKSNISKITILKYVGTIFCLSASISYIALAASDVIPMAPQWFLLLLQLLH